MATDTEVLEAELRRLHGRFNNGSRFWSFAYHFTAYGAVLMSGLTTYVSQRSSEQVWGYPKDDVSALLALITTILAAIAATGGFERKWHSNRLGRSRIDLLQLELRLSNADVPRIEADLKTLIETHDVAILGLPKAEPLNVQPDGAAAASESSPPPTSEAAHQEPRH